MAPFVRRRVSYVIPPPTEPIPRLQLPSHGLPRPRSTGPYLIQSQRTFHDSEDDVQSDSAKHPRHRLGVAALALDTATHLTGRNAPEGILYTGGRDGLVMSWDLGVPMKKRTPTTDSSADAMRRPFGRWEMMTGWADDVIDEEGEEGDDRPISDGDILGDVKMSGLRRKRTSVLKDEDIPFEHQWEAHLDGFKQAQPAQFRQCAQMHADWVNDLLLFNYNQTVVTASSDGTIKSWTPHSASPSEPSVIGAHSDYVRCLAQCREQGWIASGSFDRTIKLWDASRATAGAGSFPDALVTLNPPDPTMAKSSVYAIAADPYGHTIASGSPERVVRLWDPRSGKRTGKLVGHTDNIRAVLLSDDAKYLLTGSADASIKLWSLSSQRCLHTFTHHTDSVWSLFSTHPSLEVFYSGDKSGFVCRVDVEDCTDVSEGECVVLCQDAGECHMAATEGINKIAVLDDHLLWTASGASSIRRWRVPQRRAVRVAALQADADADREREWRAPNSPDSPHSDVRLSVPSAKPSASNVRLSAAYSASGSSENWAQPRERGEDTALHGVPFASLVKLTSPNDPFMPFSRARDPEVSTLYSAASVMSVPRPPSRSALYAAFQQSQPQPHATLPGGSPMRSEMPSRLGGAGGAEEVGAPARGPRAAYEERELAADAVPLAIAPDDVIRGDRGLVRSIILSDRLHALTVDTSGEVAVWDIVRCVCRGRYPREDVAAASQSGSTGSGGSERERSPREALEAVRERIEGEAVVSPWSNVDTKTGVLTVHINERCFEAEIYADEVMSSQERHTGDDQKLNLGKWVLRNLFLGFIREEQRQRRRHDNQLAPEDGHHGGVHRATAPMHIDINGAMRARRSSSSSRRHDPSPLNTTLISSPSMVPAVCPVAGITPRTSPLLTPLIPLFPIAKEGALPLPAIPQSPFSSNDATPLPRRRSSASGETNHSSTTAKTAPPASKESDYFSVPTRQSSAAGQVPGTPDDFSGWGSPAKGGESTPSGPTTPGGLMGRLKALGKNNTRKAHESVSLTSTAVSPVTTVSHDESTSTEASSMKSALDILLSQPFSPPSSNDAPIVALPPTTSILISEEHAPGWTITYRGTVVSTAPDAKALEQALPVWALEYLLLGKFPVVPVIKISFVLLPYPAPEGERLPELLNTAQSKLTASRFLRVRKLTAHVQEKLDKISGASTTSGTPRSSSESHSGLPRASSPTHKGSRTKGEDLYEILCNDVVLPLDMTLAVIRQYIWRSAAELVMHYRRKVNAPEWRQDGVVPRGRTSPHSMIGRVGV